MLAQFGIYPVVSGIILTPTGDGGLVQVSDDIELVQIKSLNAKKRSLNHQKPLFHSQ
ncbi:hypothetical protein CTX90_001298 [Salmonella enterica subsp. diarizonae]|nr:hypothetical protein [Salmonella enterica subsp. diarizonae]